MDLIQKVNKLGYKHYTEFTIEELDKLPLSNLNKQIEYFFIQKWLREEHDIFIWCLPNEYVLDTWHFRIETREIPNKTLSEHYKTYEEALEKGLQQTLKLI